MSHICTQISNGTEVIRPVHPHYNYDELEDCPCHLCANTRKLWTEATLQRAVLESSGNRFGKDVPPEKRYEVISLPFLAQANRRDTYCELSYLTSHKKWAVHFMQWVLARIEDDSWRGETWWAWRSQARSLGSWVEDWYDSKPACLEPKPVKARSPG